MDTEIMGTDVTDTLITIVGGLKDGNTVNITYISQTNHDH